jgi:hypothetical protein
MLLILIPFERNTSSFFLSFTLNMDRFMGNIPFNGIFILIFPIKEYSVKRNMSQKERPDPHPSEDGSPGQDHFLKILTEAFKVAAGKRKRAELREIQAALLPRGWHP